MIDIKPKGQLKAYQIKDILSSKHTKDFYATEVKTGASWGNDYLQFDAYAIKKSWVNLKYTGYEIKVARGDFLQDKKWRGYLPFCNEFYWVCPKGLIKEDEVEEDCGLIYIYPDSWVTRIVKKAKYREIEPPVDILLYLIMWRIEQPKFPYFDNKIDFFHYWLERKEFSSELGRNVSKSFREKLYKIQDVEKENSNLKQKLEDFEKIKQICNTHGIYSSGQHSIDLINLEERLSGVVSSDVDYYIKQIEIYLNKIKRISGGGNDVN
jgi:hypothetical protein